MASVAGEARADEARQQCVTDAESGQALLRSGKPRAALRPLFDCSQPTCPGLVRRDCLTYLGEAQAAVPSVVFGARDEGGHDVTDARVFLDGQPLEGALRGQVTEVEAGPHTVRFERAGAKPIEQTFVAREHDQGRPIMAQFTAKLAGASASPEPLVLDHESARGARPIPALTYALGAVSLVSAAVATGFGVRGVIDRGNDCSASHVCSASTYSQIQTSFDVADVGFGVALAALGGTVWSYLARPTRSAPIVAIDARPGSPSVTVGFAF